MEPELPRTATQQQVTSFLVNDHFVLQGKMDGQRVIVDGLKNEAWSRSGRPIALNRIKHIAANVVLDGELFPDGNVYYFDLLKAKGVDLRDPFYERHKALCELSESLGLLVVPIWRSDAKRAALEALRASNGEGVIFRDLRAPYTPGRSRNVWKHKFLYEIDCIVGAFNGESFPLYVYKDNELVDVGTVDHYKGGDMVKESDVVTVTVACVTANDRLYHVKTPKVRDDKQPEECLFEQLAHCKRSTP